MRRNRLLNTLIIPDTEIGRQHLFAVAKRTAAHEPLGVESVSTVSNGQSIGYHRFDTGGCPADNSHYA
jgi:hypothetical protein